MIEKWFEDFTLLKKIRAADGLGAKPAAFTVDTAFRGALTLTMGSEITAAGQPVLADSPVLLYDFDVTLAHGDHIRREKDGAIYRVTGRGEGMRAPAWSGLRFAQTPVERLVIPC